MNNNSNHTFWTTVKQAFEIKNVPFPWIKSLLAGICAGIPIFLGLLFGNFQYGMYGSIGSFTFLYMFNEPLAQRAKKLFFVAVGLAAAVGIGTLLAPYPLAMAVAVGFIGAFVTFIFGTLKFPGPAAIFFVLAVTLTSAMNINPSEAPIRAGLVFLGGMLSWTVAMSGWFINRRGSETKALKAVYNQLASLIDSASTDTFSVAREKALQQIKVAGDTLSAGYISWDKSMESRKLYYLYEQANHIFSEVVEYHAKEGSRIPEDFGQAIREFVKSLEGGKSSASALPKVDDHPMLIRLSTRIREVDEVLTDPEKAAKHDIHIRKPPVRSLFAGALHKNSIVFISSLRNGFIMVIAALIAFSFDFDRAYWIPLSCAAVMMGTTVMTTFHRAIQRSVGTIIGVLIASMLLASQPEGWMIAVIITVLTFGAEMFIPRNYALAAFFFTSTAIFMAENATQIFDVGYFAAIRATDVLIGCTIGLAGTYLIGRRSASSRLPHLLSKTIRSEMQVLAQLFSDNTGTAVGESGDMRKMQTNLNNLNLVYSTALGEIPRNKPALHNLWPIIFSTDQLGYLLEAAAKEPNRTILSDEEMAHLLLTFEKMAQAAKQEQPLSRREIPRLPSHPHIEKEIADLQTAMQLRK
ncbi:FUSC family protein [Virgibacillus xinjiangensis]|uniref:FUSC family protein n=1 Tax=Virgibacillus xinjiangensis TaxID=393090 RepID=A0ABV7CU59_9BACI